MQLLHRGDFGPAVAEIKAILASQGLLPSSNGHIGDDQDQVFDGLVEHAVRAFQQQRGLITDGVVGTATYRALRDARWSLGDRPLAYQISQSITGDDVFALQERLLELGYDAGRPNKVFGAQTEHALKSFQRDYGITADGVCGPETLRSLRQLMPKVRGGRPVLLREQERVRTAGPRLRGKRIVLDPGHGGADRGAVVEDAAEADLAWDLARRLEGRMVATGMEALLVRGPDTCPPEAERAAFANDAGADLFLSLHTDTNPSPAAQGIASYHFGTGNGTTSTVGEALAGYIQREVVAKTGMVDCGSHPKTWEVLRLTRMPAVHIEVGYLTNAADRRRLMDPTFRDILAERILVAVKRLYLLGENDQPTGTFTFDDLLRHELAKID
ncbi:N-acetylmuramoyl-L-alanine amidase [Actinoalloteichus hoggarensis]|uniref:N-acetylmuramoyl-L-alanine amidase LytC n=1 Tax=Actinoalloteichus hoggarensis TaxID=1470176 RepID=A0A221WD43_9PSEU|nr:N-acetylmuramoyl-L-alanine amidase [Actinoalloteichus hoggarensis]ASO23187.1 N-acetylmuramoyl-L-alanine amidase LytC precursor [Actinoalloteichus hoggarensis]MBB5922792.1 N-acetylmuramoyl-L-alanine amidase [Actinoalloteichus hoggarensis]